jgi:hypothetical protein
VDTGPTLGDVLAQGVNDFFERRERRKETEYQRERQRKQDERDELALALSGIHRGTAPVEQDRDIYAPKLETGDGLAGALQGGLSIGGTNEVKGSMFDQSLGMGAAPKPVPLGAFDKTTGQFNRGEPVGTLPSQYEQLTPGYYRDRNETPEQRQIDRQYAAREQEKQDAREKSDRLVAALGGAAIPPDVAPLLAENPKLLEDVGGKLIEKRLGLGSLTDKNIDPRSREGIAADKELIAYRAQMEAAAAAQKAAQAANAPRKVPAATMAGLAKNEAAVQRIKEAIAAVQAYPDAVGLKRMVSDDINQRVDPKGIDARSKLARIASIEVHSLAGSNQTAREMQNLGPYLPKIRDDSKAIVEKLQNMQRAIESENAMIREKYGLGETVDVGPNGTPLNATGTNVGGGGKGPVNLGSGVSDADMWEQLVAAGVSKDEATRRVQARHKP